MKNISLLLFKDEELLILTLLSILIVGIVYLISKKVNKKDFFPLLSITLVYALISLWNLGSNKIPTTTWQPVEAYQSFILEVEDGFNQINLIYGEGDNNSLEKGYQLGIENMIIEGSNDLYNWVEISTLEKGRIFEYSFIEGDYNYKYIRITSTNIKQTLTEIAFIKDNELVNVSVYEDKYSDSKYPASLVIDEQDKVVISPTYYDEFYFDEIYHVRNAKEVADGQYMYASVHPLLGTNIIASFIKLFGFTPFVFRLPGALFGIAIVVLIYLLAKLLFDKTIISSLAAILSACDFMHLTTSRIATLEPFSIFFIILMFYWMIKYYKEEDHKKEIVDLLICGISMGLAISTKWTACYSAIGLAIILFKKLTETKKNVISSLLWCVLFFVIIPLIIYWLSYLPDKVWRDSWSIKNVWEHNITMFEYHSKLVSTHPYSSKWYQWLLDIRPIWYYSNINDVGISNTIACFSNPLLTWAGIPAIIYCLFKIKDRISFVIVIGYLTAILPWTPISRTTFAYHFYPTSIFVILAICFCANKLMEKRNKNRQLIYIFMALYVLIFIVYLPICTGFGTTKVYIKALELFPTWYFG